ncbi:MAG TPA: bifunctional UDP-sugar hydrolase/5'-nucleotidase [Thermoanaerobaculia bacterium]|nr:bifunctional UDP-sugar hydrolase/5'-nucleotidase [Thermoanaerobaculia bacterium]
MRRMVVFAALLALTFVSCATLPPQQTAAAPQAARFKILQINDVYKVEGLDAGATGGLARVRWLRELLESDGTPVLVLHAGDALYPSVMSKYLDARPMVDVLNRLDGDAQAMDERLIVTFGNHEFDKSTPDILLARLADSQFHWIATNTNRCDSAGKCDQPFPGVPRTLVEDIGGTRVGFFGVLYPGGAGNKYASTTDVLAAARDAVTQLQSQGARVIVGVTHEDMADDVKLAQSVPGVDLIIGGHDHLFAQQKAGNTWITKADADAKSVIVYDVTVPATGPARTAPLRIAMDTTMPKDSAIDATVQTWMTTLATKLGGNETLGRTKYLLEGVEPAVRGRETALGNLLTDVARAKLGTDIAFLNGGGIRINDNIPPGPITSYDMEGIFYYNNDLVSFPLKGSELLEMLANSISRVDAGDGRFLQISGFTYRYHKEGDHYVVTDVKIGGQPLDPAKTYTATTVDFLYQRGTEDGYQIFSDARRPPKIAEAPDLRAATEAYVRSVGTVEKDVEGRIVRE